jgi:hypothetical protein
LIFKAPCIDANRPSDVLDLLLAQVLESEIELVANVGAHHSADANAARFCEPHQSGRDIHPIAEDVVFLNNAVNPDGARDVLQLLLAHVLEGKIELASSVSPHACRNTNPAGFGQGFEPRPLITQDPRESATALRILAAEIEHLVTSRVRQWLRDPGGNYQSTWLAGKHCCLGPQPVGASANRAAV